MLTRLCTLLATLTLTACAPMNTPTPTATDTSAAWTPLFDGRSLEGWRASDAPGSFSVKANRDRGA